MNKEFIYVMQYLNYLSKEFYENYKSFISFSFFNDLLKIRIDTSTGFHCDMFYTINETLEERLKNIFQEFEKEIVKWSLHIKKGDNNDC